MATSFSNGRESSSNTNVSPTTSALPPGASVLATLTDDVDCGIGEARGTSVERAPIHFAFRDLFTFRDNLIARVEPYLVALS
jgi:hypothetical protein